MANTYTQLAQDTFQRGSYPENPLSDGGAWIVSPGVSIDSLQIVKVGSVGVCEGQATFNYGIMYFNGSVSWPDNQYSEITLGTIAAGTQWGSTARWSSLLENGYLLRIDGATGGSVVCHIWLMAAGVQSVLKSITGITANSGDVFRLEAQGSTLTAYQNGSAIGNVTDTTYTSGFPGMLEYANGTATNIQFTEWDGGSIYAGTVLSVGLVPNSVTYPTTSTGTVTLSAPAPTGGIVVTLTSSDTTVATVPASVTVLAGNTTATFTVTSLNKSGTPSITGTIGSGSNASATLTASQQAVAASGGWLNSQHDFANKRGLRG